MARANFIRASIVSVLVLFSPMHVAAGIFDQLLMPGPVIRAHADFERDCESCHTKLEKEQQNRLCTGCHDHEDVAKDIDAGQGFHGRNRAVRNAQCSHCHSDHKGRTARIVLFNPATFKHRDADFELKGKHQEVECSSCHGKDKKYSEAPALCVDCHKVQDPHAGRLGEKCQDCHKENSWDETGFDHDRDTKFKLDGRHSELVCKLCHAGERYKKTPQECVTCHLINDRHKGGYGEECGKCHSTDEWKESKFDHTRDTEFDLTGRHQNAACKSCHRGNLFEDKLSVTCVSCHKLDDQHKGKNGRGCQKCHDTKEWASVHFRHENDTKFPLTGQHEHLACEACHKESAVTSKLELACISCHRDDDVHREQQGTRCQKCHNEAGWGEGVFFDHDLSRFPLIGQHSALACEGCHRSAAYRDTEIGCFACHEGQDVHNEAFGEQCSDCHTPNGWKFWFFDHETQTDYPLEGKHKGLSCEACHSGAQVEGKERDTQCFACHDRDDRHRGDFGRDCDRCHETSSFAEVTYPR